MKYIHLTTTTHNGGKRTVCSVGPFATPDGLIQWGDWLDEAVADMRDEGQELSVFWKAETEPLERNYDVTRSPDSVLEIERNRN